MLFLWFQIKEKAPATSSIIGSTSLMDAAISLAKTLLLLLFLLISSAQNAKGCYTSIFAFGDSLTDTGNYIHLYPQIFPNSKHFPRYGLPPYGKTFFHRPTGRCSDGRVIVDFICQFSSLQNTLRFLYMFELIYDFLQIFAYFPSQLNIMGFRM